MVVPADSLPEPLSCLFLRPPVVTTRRVYEYATSYSSRNSSDTGSLSQVMVILLSEFTVVDGSGISSGRSPV